MATDCLSPIERFVQMVREYFADSPMVLDFIERAENDCEP